MNTVQLTKGELTNIILQEVRRLNEQGADADMAAANAARTYFQELLGKSDEDILAAYTIITTATREN